jgi:UDP-glucose 4-epimerase
MDNYFNKKNVLITGGLGFLGSNLAHRLVEEGALVTLVDNLATLYGGNIFNVKEIEKKISLVINDMRNMDIMKPLIEKADVIYHLGAQVSYIDSLSIPYEDQDLNATATLNILECCRKLNPGARIMFSSSRMIYGKVEQPIITEDSPNNPLSLYGIHKLTSEKYLMMYYKDFGIPATVLRVTNPYGPRQQIKHSKYSLVGWFIRQAMEGKVIRIFGDGAQLRDYIFVDDIVNAMMKCAEAPSAAGEVINLGSGQSSRFCDMVSTVVKHVKNGRIEFVPWPDNYEKIETGDVSFDISKLRRITGWSPDFSLDDGVQKTFEYYSKFSEHYK